MKLWLKVKPGPAACVKKKLVDAGCQAGRLIRSVAGDIKMWITSLIEDSVACNGVAVISPTQLLWCDFKPQDAPIIGIALHIAPNKRAITVFRHKISDHAIRPASQ